MPAPVESLSSLCLVRLSALGDVVLATALVRTLQANFPRCRLTWVTTPLAAELLRGLDGVEFVVIDKPRRPGDYLAFRRRMRGRRFDVLLAAQANFRVNLLHAFVPARRKIGFDARRARDLHTWFVSETIPRRDEHLADGFLAFAGALGVAPENYVRETVVPLAEADFAGIAGLRPAGRYLVMNPAASKPERTWPAENYAAVADFAVSRTGWPVVLTGGGGPREKELAQAVVRCAVQPITDLTGRTTVRQLAALLARAEGLVAPDTGPVHIADALGTPVVGLYAVARAALAGPWRDQRYCVDQYDAASRAFLGRPAAAVDWHRRVHHPGAMALITVDEVCTKVAQLAADRERR